MKKKVFIPAIAFLTILGASSTALAGGSSVGNGGNTIVCKDANGQITSVELLDFYEARVKRGITPDLGDPNLSVDDKVKMALKRLFAVDGTFAAQLNNEAARFTDNSVFLPGIQLVPIDDSDHLFVPADCQQVQTAVQKTPEFPGDKLYNIDQDLWNRMDNTNRAGLILHEVFYHMSLNEGKPDDSVPIRFLVSSIASSTSISLKELVEVARTLKYPYIGINGLSFKIGDYMPAFNTDGSLNGGDLYETTPYTIQGKTIWIRAVTFTENQSIYSAELDQDAYLKMGDQTLWFAAGSYVGFDLNGSVSAGSLLPQNVEFKVPGLYDLSLSEAMKKPAQVQTLHGELIECDLCQGTFTLLGQTFEIDSYLAGGAPSTVVHLAHPTTLQFGGQSLLIQGKLWVSANNELQDLTLAAPATFTIGQNQVLFDENEMSFARNGQVTSGFLAKDTTLPSADGGQVPYLKGMEVFFDEQGRVLRGSFPHP